MKTHKNSSLTVRQRSSVKLLYASGAYTRTALAARYGVCLKTISKWISRSEVSDLSSAPKQPRRSITAAFQQAVIAYREDPLTEHHGVVRISEALKAEHSCSNASNVYLVLKRLKLTKASKVRDKAPRKSIPVGKHRTQMDIQQLPPIKGSQVIEYKISIIHLSTRMKYSEIHDNYRTETIAKVYEHALDTLPPFS